MRRDDIIVGAVAVMIAAVILFIAAMFVAQTRAQKSCLALGWPHAKVDYTLTAYCVRRVDQTDIVRPLSTLR